jgi:hypothetical protein
MFMLVFVAALAWGLIANPFGSGRSFSAALLVFIALSVFTSWRAMRKEAAVAVALEAIAAPAGDALSATTYAMRLVGLRSAKAAQLASALVVDRFARGDFEAVLATSAALLAQIDERQHRHLVGVDEARLMAASALDDDAAIAAARARLLALPQHSGRVVTLHIAECVQEFVRGDPARAKAKLDAARDGVAECAGAAAWMVRAIDEHDVGQPRDGAPYRGGVDLRDALRAALRARAPLRQRTVDAEFESSIDGLAPLERSSSAQDPVTTAQNEREFEGVLRLIAVLAAIAIATYPRWCEHINMDVPSASSRGGLWFFAAMLVVYAVLAPKSEGRVLVESQRSALGPEIAALEAQWALSDREATRAGYEAIVERRGPCADVARALANLSILAERRGDFDESLRCATRAVEALDTTVAAQDPELHANVTFRWACALALVGRVRDAQRACLALRGVSDVASLARLATLLAAARAGSDDARQHAMALDGAIEGWAKLVVDAVLAEHEPPRAARLRAQLARWPSGARWLAHVAPRYAPRAVER